MKNLKRNLFFVALTATIFTACTKENQEDLKAELKADFEVTVAGEAPNAVLAIANMSENASNYEWTFGEGASEESSADENPAGITVDKTGDLEITLVVMNESEEQSVTKSIAITGNNAIVSYSDVTFGWGEGIATYGRAFSTETGTMYKDSEITEENGEKIDLVFLNMSGVLNYFDSPVDADAEEEELVIPNATATIVDNYPDVNTFDKDAFDEVTHAGLLENMTVEHTGEAFGSNHEGRVVVFENAQGKAGVLKIKEQVDNKIVVDIKVEKY